MKANSTLSRHCAVLLLAIALTYLFLGIHSTLGPVHRWNRALADASLVLLATTMMIGPLVRLRSAWSWIVPWRRELGIYSIVFGVIHFFLILDGWIRWDLPQLAGLLVHPLRGDYVMAEHGFGLANIIGIVALGYGSVLLATSSERAVQHLGGSVWKFVHRGAYVLWTLAVLHTAYFLFMHFLHFDRPVPAPNPLQWPFVSLVAAVMALRTAATIRTWRALRRTTVKDAAEERAPLRFSG